MGNPSVLQNREFTDLGRPDSRPEGNLFDLSHEHKTTGKMGYLMPFVTLETLPGDSFEISAEVMIRFMPLYLPIMHRCDLKIHYFYVPNRILWQQPDGWEDYITQYQDLAHPTIVLDTTQESGNLLVAEYMGFPLNHQYDVGVDEITYAVNAFPIAGYYKIWDDFYRNPQIQTEKFIALEAGQNLGYTYASGRQGVVLDNWNIDYFTACTPEPAVGDPILIPVANEDYVTPVNALGVKGPWQLRKQSDDTVVSSSGVEHQDWGSGEYGLISGVGGTKYYLDVQETAGTIQQLRTAVRMQEYLEKLMRTGQRYRDMIKGFYGIDPFPGEVDEPVFIGGSRGRITVQEVLSNTETLDSTDAVTQSIGSYAGQAMALEGGKTVKYKCKEHGFIIGIINVQPRSSYWQGIERMWKRSDPFDYAWKQFAGIGDQEVLRDEVYHTWITADQATNDAVFGYIPRYSDYRYKNDIVSGRMRTDFQHFHLGRQWTDGAPPTLNTVFLECLPRVEDVFVMQSTDHEMFIHIWNHVKVYRDLPKYGIPSL